MNGQTTAEKIIQNLKDAGCSDEQINTFVGINGDEKFERQLELLKKHRQRLLAEMHRYQKQIDCLDYLTFNLEKQNRKFGELQ